MCKERVCATHQWPVVDKRPYQENMETNGRAKQCCALRRPDLPIHRTSHADATLEFHGQNHSLENDDIPQPLSKLRASLMMYLRLTRAECSEVYRTATVVENHPVCLAAKF